MTEQQKLDDLQHKFSRANTMLRLAIRNRELAEASVKNNLRDVQAIGREILRVELNVKAELLDDLAT